MKTRDDILMTLRTALPHLRQRYAVSELALFGSYAREEQGEGSDVDIAVTFTETPRFTDFMAVQEELCELLGERVDLVMRDGMKPLIRARAEAEAVAV